MSKDQSPARIWINPNSAVVCNHAPSPEPRDVEYIRADLIVGFETGLNLFRQLVGGKNSLRTLEVFPCNQAEHEDVDCKCFWEQCEAWASKDGSSKEQHGADIRD